MFKVEFKVNGRRVSANRVGAEFAAAAKQAVQEEALRRVRSARCPTHHRGPTNVHGWPNVRFDACCEDLKVAIAQAVS